MARDGYLASDKMSDIDSITGMQAANSMDTQYLCSIFIILVFGRYGCSTTDNLNKLPPALLQLCKTLCSDLLELGVDRPGKVQLAHPLRHLGDSVWCLGSIVHDSSTSIRGVLFCSVGLLESTKPSSAVHGGGQTPPTMSALWGVLCCYDPKDEFSQPCYKSCCTVRDRHRLHIHRCLF